MPDGEELLLQLKRLLSDRRECLEDNDIEKLVFDLSQSSEDLCGEAVRFMLENLSPGCYTLFSWFLLYKIVDPLVVLQLYILKKEVSLFDKSGTDQLASDVMDHLQIRKQKGIVPRFEVNTNFTPISIDVLEYLKLDSLPKVPKRAFPKPYEEIPTSVAKKVKPDLSVYEANIRKTLNSSMSAEECVHKLNALYQKNTEDSVASTIFKAAYGTKLYNRLYGNIALRLSKTNMRLWRGAWPKVFVSFYTDQCESVDADRLKVAGTFFGHLLSTDVLDWKESLKVIRLDAEHTTPSQRILFFAVVEEMRVSMGAQAVEKRILGLGDSVDGLLHAELSSGFWELAKFPTLANLED